MSAIPELGGSLKVQYVIIFFAIVLIISLLVNFWYLAIPAAIIAVIAWKTPSIVREMRKRRYFASEDFAAHKAEIAALTYEHNEVTQYVAEIRDRGSFEVGATGTGRHAHLATFENTSAHNYRRDRNVAEYAASNVHNCSLQLVRNAASNPIKYVTKYFDIKADEDTLADVETLGESIASLEAAVANLRARESQIVGVVSPPPFIMRYFADEFMSQVGVKLSPVSVPYPEYRFEYVSAGGNSSQRTTVKLDTPAIDAMVEFLAQSIRFRKSAAGQRALMTARLRAYIKDRDGWACKSCGASVRVEPNLLLEVDHIVPVSRGGMTVEENLQTLCWRCNRSKSNKLIAS
ncbi:HNH endonuclease [Microbacterium sp. NPDC006705]|uniref:HNH endonuclease n=1 Tax=Microbacterium TaxID=33882 RepID=UPI0023670FBA|nr:MULTISPECIES: HNH endonuclease signature motif containing protein [Microbacterium]WHE37373.1 HNH endonuclease signature motif containing protein [Microbacterium sp. BDGP8]WRK18552.1 HNH endonuclease signature motif containing protein [Microbacterium plantarum]